MNRYEQCFIGALSEAKRCFHEAVDADRDWIYFERMIQASKYVAEMQQWINEMIEFRGLISSEQGATT